MKAKKRKGVKRRQKKRQVVLLVMDGVGISKDNTSNAFSHARTPNLDFIMHRYPHALLGASNGSVGLPKHQIGGSEVGHLHIGAGRLVKQDLVKIDDAIKNGSFFKNKVLNSAIKKSKGHKLHLIGLLSDGGVHSHIDHLFALVELANRYGIKPIVHGFLDGRDVPPNSGLKYAKQIMARDCILGTLCGRFYAMDRDHRWTRTELAYNLLVKGEGMHYETVEKAFKQSYDEKIYDEFFKPVIVNKIPIEDGDTVLFFNFRGDRARQITRCFIDKRFEPFVRKKVDVNFSGMATYEKDFKMPIAFPKELVKNTLGEVLSKKGLRQLRIAETEKYAHVTYFFSGERERLFKGEKRKVVPSPHVDTYDLKPEMSVYKVTSEFEKMYKKFDFVMMNFANGDMVGHTGDYKATMKAVEALDKCVGRVLSLVRENHGILIITADHGNCEKMLDGPVPLTAHTMNPVPFIICTDGLMLEKSGALYNIAPTVLDLMGISKPKGWAQSMIMSKKA